MSGKLNASILFLALAMALSFPSTCPIAQRSIYLAAVTGEDTGGVFQLHVEVGPGNGTIYTSINPETGFATQQSEEAAAAYAFSSTGIDRSSCDVLYSMSGDFGNSTVDGPSAGGAIAIATRAALLNRTIRQDTVMTGTISSDGKVGAVGGIIEKGKGAADAGAKYFILPKPEIYESVLLSSISRSKDFHAIDVENLSEAEAILFSSYSQNFSSKFVPESKMAPALPQIKMDADLGRFALVAKKVVSDLQLKISQTYPPGSAGADTSNFSGYFTKEVAKYDSLIPQGYVFTAANSAFLLSIDVEYAKIGDSGVDLTGSIDDVSKCVAALPQAAKTKENMQWAIGADLRRLWAQERLNQTLAARSGQDGYTTLQDLLFVKSWCGISSDLSSQASEIGGTGVNESALEALSSKELLSAKESFSGSKKQDYDALWHLQNAEDANASGEYGAAIYESAYARIMQDAASESVENVTSASESLMNETRSSLWGKIYAGQGAYLFYDDKSSGFSPDDAYTILKYAQELDRVSAEIDSTEANPPQNVSQAPSAPAQASGQTPAPCVSQPILEQLLTAAVLLLLIAFSLFSIRKAARGKKGMVK